MKTIDYSYFIERYNSGEIDEKERKWLELELKDNPALQKELILRKKTDEALGRTDIITLRRKLASIEKAREESRTQAAKARSKGSVLRYAAIMTGIIIIGGYLLFTSLNNNRNVGYSDYFSPYEISSARSFYGGNTGDNFALGTASYQNEDFESALRRFNMALADDPNNTELIFYRGSSNFNLKRYSLAIPDFEAVINEKTSMYKDIAQWDLTLCYIETGALDKAIKNLEEIISAENSYSKLALKLLRKID